MSNIAEKVFKALPEQQAAAILDFAEFLQAKMGQPSDRRREKALAALDKYVGIYDGSRFNREELHDH